jgi:hypothetical protein
MNKPAKLKQESGQAGHHLGLEREAHDPEAKQFQMAFETF